MGPGNRAASTQRAGGRDLFAKLQFQFSQAGARPEQISRLNNSNLKSDVSRRLLIQRRPGGVIFVHNPAQTQLSLIRNGAEGVGSYVTYFLQTRMSVTGEMRASVGTGLAVSVLQHQSLITGSSIHLVPQASSPPSLP